MYDLMHRAPSYGTISGMLHPLGAGAGAGGRAWTARDVERCLYAEAVAQAAAGAQAGGGKAGGGGAQAGAGSKAGGGKKKGTSAQEQPASKKRRG